MFRARASRIPARVALAAVLLMTIVTPVSGGSPLVSVVTTASPTSVTVDHAIGYIVNVANNGQNTLNHVTLDGEIRTPGPDGELSDDFEYLGAFTDGARAPACSQPPAEAAFCDFGQLAARTPAPEVTLYYQAPPDAGMYDFFPIVRVGEGGTDNGSASHVDTFPDPMIPIVTGVLAVNDDLVRGHAILGFREFTTGLGALDGVNQHGTTVRIPKANAEVTVKDLEPDDEAVACPVGIAATCFGWGSSFSVGDGGLIEGGIEVTMRWDASELPKGMTPRKLRIAHLLGDGLFDPIKDPCVFDEDGVPVAMPCISVAPFALRDKDIQASFFVASNRVSRGY